VPVGIGPDELRGDLGAINGRRHDTEGLEQDRNIETGEMKQFGDFRSARSRSMFFARLWPAAI